MWSDILTITDLIWLPGKFINFCGTIIAIGIGSSQVPLKNGDATERHTTQGVFAGRVRDGFAFVSSDYAVYTEELWNKVAPLVGRKNTPFIMQAQYPQARREKINPEAEEKWRFLLRWSRLVVS